MKQKEQLADTETPLLSSTSSVWNDAGLQTSEIDVKRTIFITSLAGLNAVVVGFIAKGLVLLISFFTNLFFFGKLSVSEVSPANNHLGLWVIAIPVFGGILVGLMARYGSKAIRGHGIPEAMEKILVDESKIPPLITFLKPFSAAISIGTGGPFGAEGPIIATGGAFGSVGGQLLHTTARERKVLLAAGATAGMTAIFGTPFAAILLAIELLLFEFSAKSFVPVVIACVTGACMHFLLFGNTPTFPFPQIAIPDKNAIIAYAAIGLLVGLAAVAVTKAVYWVEDAFEKLPLHWMWWPAIGGFAVGVIGYIAPATLGVGYSNIIAALSGTLGIQVLFSLCLFKFISWAIALGSGTSGGTLAPLLTIGSTLGCLLGLATQHLLPQAHVSLPLAALIGMAALFAGASRALLTAIVFALETTMQENTLLPLIAGCVTSYMVSFVLMRGTIMTEKINRRGVITPDSFHPDVLQNTLVAEVLMEEEAQEKAILLNSNAAIAEAKETLLKTSSYNYNSVFLVDDNFRLLGVISKTDLLKTQITPESALTDISSSKVYSLYTDNNLQLAVHFLLKTRQDVLPVIDRKSQTVKGSIAAINILKAYEKRIQHDTVRLQSISAKANILKAIDRGRQFFNN